MGSQFYLQSASTSAASIPLSRSTSNHPSTPSRNFASPSPPPSAQRRPNPTSLNITFGDGFSDSDDSDDASALPFPAPLPRADFIVAGDFDPSAYLSRAVSNRYQTLEDLRSELRGRVGSLNDELVELVNRHQEEFVGLGGSLRGGEERIEEVRVGVLGLRREVEDVRRHVEAREKSVEEALKLRREVRESLQIAKMLLEFERSLGELEDKLGFGAGSMGQNTKREDTDQREEVDESEDSSDDDDDEDADEAAGGFSLARLRRRIEELQKIHRLAKKAGQDHPFIQAQQQRVARCRGTLLLDLNACLKHMKGSANTAAQQKLQLLSLYSEIDAAKEAVQMLKLSQ